MRSGTGSAVHVSGYCITGNITEVTQILECFWIALADYLCGIISVKHPDQLPRITIAVCVRIRHCFIIIVCQIADHFLISNQFLCHRRIPEFIYNLFCICRRCFCYIYHAGIYPILIGCIAIAYRHGYLQICNPDNTFTATYWYRIIVAPLRVGRFLIPV